MTGRAAIAGIDSEWTPGELLGRLVLGYEDGEVRIFAASIF